MITDIKLWDSGDYCLYIDDGLGYFDHDEDNCSISRSKTTQVIISKRYNVVDVVFNEGYINS